MPRPAKHDEGSILSAAAALVASRGPGAATMTAISAAMGAPNGSLYHRFRSRDELMGRLWLGKAAFFQSRWADAMADDDPRQAGLAAALSLPRAVRDDFEGARIMLLHRREDFLGDGWSTEMRAEAERLGGQQRDLTASLTRRLFGRDTLAKRRITAFAVMDLPVSAVKRYVADGERPPPLVDALIARAYAAVMETSDSAEAAGLPPP